MASINIRIDDNLKVRAYLELERLGITPSELMRQTLQYVAERGQLPFRPVLLTEEDEALMTMSRTHETAEYASWFREQVQQGLTEADDPKTQWVSHEESKVSWATKRAQLVKRIETSAS